LHYLAQFYKNKAELLTEQIKLLEKQIELMEGQDRNIDWQGSGTYKWGQPGYKTGRPLRGYKSGRVDTRDTSLYRPSHTDVTGSEDDPVITYTGGTRHKKTGTMQSGAWTPSKGGPAIPDSEAGDTEIEDRMRKIARGGGLFGKGVENTKQTPEYYEMHIELTRRRKARAGASSTTNSNQTQTTQRTITTQRTQTTQQTQPVRTVTNTTTDTPPLLQRVAGQPDTGWNSPRSVPMAPNKPPHAMKQPKVSGLDSVNRGGIRGGIQTVNRAGRGVPNIGGYRDTSGIPASEQAKAAMAARKEIMDAGGSEREARMAAQAAFKNYKKQ